MINKDPDTLLSICIPTRSRTQVLINTLNSIYEANIDPALFEVVIYDSSDNCELLDVINKQFKVNNLHYKHGENFGYLNLIEVLRLGKGTYLKLHNDYCSFKEGSLEAIINQIRNSIIEKPLLFFSNGSLNNIGKLNFSSFNDFLYNISYYSTWSTLFGIWKSDFDILNKIDLNPMFPHTSMLYAISCKKTYQINNTMLFNNQDVGSKGGYNLFKVFAVDYLNMVEDLYKKSKITKITFNHIKKDILFNFFITWYAETKILNNKYTFSLSGIKSSMKVHYSVYEYHLMILFAYVKSFNILLVRFLYR